MSKFNIGLNTFTGGEFSPTMEGRSDVKEYSAAAAKLLNYIPRKQGGVSQRPGTRLITEIQSLGSPGNGGAALLPFIFSKTEAYVIAIKNNGVLPGVTPFLQIFRNDGVQAVVDIQYNLSVIPATVDPRGYNFAQSGDLMFVTHSSGTVRPLIIFRISNNSFRVTELETLINIPDETDQAKIAPVLRVPYRDVNTTATTITPNVAAGNGTFTASAPIFNADHIGAIFKTTHAGVTGAARITAFTSSTVVGMTVLNTLGGVGATDNWQEQAWSDHRGWPKTVAIFEQRIFWGGNEAQPDKIWASKLGNLFHMMERRFQQDITNEANTSGIRYFIETGVPDEQTLYTFEGIRTLPTDPFGFTIASQEVNKIVWLSSGRSLHIGTFGAEYIMSSSGESLNRVNVSIKQQTNNGGSPVKPVRIDNEVLYVDRDGRRIRNFKFNDANGSYLSDDITSHAEHIVKHGNEDFNDVIQVEDQFKDSSYQISRQVGWYLNDINDLVGVTYATELSSRAWHKHIFGGERVNVWGVTSIPNVSGSHDDVYVLTGRLIDGGIKYFLEKFVADFDADSLDNSSTLEENIPIYTDAAVIQTLAASDTLTGLGTHEGETLIVTKNGVKFGSFVVAGGEIDLGSPQTGRFVSGFPMVAEVESLDLESGGNFGTSKGSIKRVDEATLRVYKTVNLEVKGNGNNNWQPLKMANTNALNSGKFQVHPHQGPGLESKISFRNTEPYPSIILSLILQGETDD